jgi:hypothetical protein|tara:strand:+ start:34 stop:468 length:435 start_codon:yes stop_codon:yes gene_type:complete
MNPVVADIKKEWDWVGNGIREIHAQFPWLEYRPEDVYAACTNGTAALYKTDQGFAVFTVETHPINGHKSFLCWLAWGKNDKKGSLIAEHFNFFCNEGKKLGCKRINVKTPIDGLDKFLVSQGWRVDMRDFSFNLADNSAAGEII